MLRRTFPLLPWCVAVVSVTLLGCSSRPTYPKERLAESLQGLLTEGHLNASVRYLHHTVAVQVDHPDALTQDDGQLTIGPAFDEVARKVLSSLHRVLLSTDAEVLFYVLLVSDPKIPGAYLTMVRYMDDLRRANANMLDTPEMFARTIFELNLFGPKPLTIEQFVPRDIHLEEFLSWQLARRIQHKLTDELQAAGLADVGRCGGEFRDGEFVFTLNVAPTKGDALDEGTIRKVFEESTGVIAHVLQSYRFDAFDGIRLIHLPTGRNFVLPKTRLSVLR
jgi:hypothetical protein